MIVAFARVIRQELEEEKQGFAGSILRGQLKDWDEYRHITGKIAGIDRALSVLDDTVQRFEQQ